MNWNKKHKSKTGKSQNSLLVYLKNSNIKLHETKCQNSGANSNLELFLNNHESDLLSISAMIFRYPCKVMRWHFSTDGCIL